ncbi:MAG: TonB-dependent receptor [Bacteroidia bacterium]
MNKILFFITTFYFLSLTAYSQTFNLKGKITEGATRPAVGAGVALLNPDSSLVKGTITDTSGNFLIDDVLPHPYILKIVYLGFSNYYKALTVNENSDLGSIKLKTFARQLKEVEVATSAIAATQNGDTTSYNSKAYKTNRDATAEDMVTKMPGVTVTDGKVQAQGEDVKQVLVDGQFFFGDDATSVLKNLPAEIIDKVQVFDKKSDQSQFTGIDDGNTSKTINIVTKAQFRNGTFGKAYAGYGYEDKYRAGGVMNRFKDKQRFTVLLMSNNVNEQNFSSEDLLGVTAGSTNQRRGGQSGGGSRGGSSGGPQSSADNFLVNIKNGISTTNARGLNYSDKWGSKVTVSSSYFFNRTDNNSVSSLLRQYVVGANNGLNYAENSDAKSTNYNHRFNSRFEIKLDSFNSLIIQPKISIQQNIGNSGFVGQNINSDVLISKTNNNFGSDLMAMNFSLPVQLRHSFRKRGRTISLDLNPSYNSSGGNNSLQNYNTYYTNTFLSDTIDQRSRIDKSGFSGTANFIYTEPINKNSFLSVNYSGSYTGAKSEKYTYNRDSVPNSYTLRDSLLSNAFTNQYQSQAGGMNYRYQKEKLNFSVGALYQVAQLDKQQQFPSTYSATKNFESILPTAFFQYKFTQKKNLRVNYRSTTAAPSIDQLQNVLNNSNSLQLSTGNPDLKQSFQNNLNIRYSGVNTEKATSLFFLLSGTYADNYISNSTLIARHDTLAYNNVFLARGSQITRPVNLNNYYNARVFINYGFAIKKLKSNLNINASATYNNVPALINNQVNYSNTTNTGLGLVLSSNISDRLDFTLSSTPSYNYVSNTLQSSLNSTYFNTLSKAKITYTPVKWLQLMTEYSNQKYSGLTGGFNQNISLLNAAIAYKFLKEQNAELRIYVFDILKQNKSVQRTTTETYIEDSQTNILQRYFMLTFTYNFKKFFEKKK